MDVQQTLTRNVGPLPVWGWGVLVGGSVLIFRFVRNRGDSEPTMLEEDAGVFAVTRTSRSPTSLVSNIADNGAPDTVMLEETVSRAISEMFELIDPRLMSIEDSNAMHSDALDDLRISSEQRIEEEQARTNAIWQWWLDTFGRWNEMLDTRMSGTEAAVNQLLTAPPPSEPVVVSSPHTAPAPEPTHRQPVPGEHVWKGANPPNTATINNLLMARYGKIVPTRTTRPGGGGYLVVVA